MQNEDSFTYIFKVVSKYFIHFYNTVFTQDIFLIKSAMLGTDLRPTYLFGNKTIVEIYDDNIDILSYTNI